MGYGDGVYQGMQDGDLFRAQSSDARSRANARRSEDEANQLHIKNQLLVREIHRLKSGFESNTALASAGLIVINAMLKAMDDLPDPVMRERFRERVSQLARNRMREVDAQPSEVKDRKSILNEFQGQPEARLLGIN